ncbi:MAG: HEAT repeat domain-containing protein [Leptonema sp. (in: bacteria)]
MKKLYNFIIIFVIYSSSLLSIDISSENLIKMMNQGGEERIKAIWIGYQTKQYYLLRKAAKYLNESDNPLEHRMILRIFKLLGDDLVSILPNWYILLDQFISNKRDKETLLDSLELARKWKEQRLVFSIIRLTKHPEHQIRKEAILTLKELNSDIVIPIIVESLKSSNELLILYGLENSIYYTDKRLIPFIREFVLHPNVTIRIFAIRALSNYESETFYLFRNIDKEEDDVILAMIELIEQKKFYNNLYLLNNTLNHPNKNIRLATIRTFRNLKNYAAVSLISRHLLIENDEDVIQEGILTLIELEKGDPSRSLVFLLQHKNKDIRILTLKAIHKLNMQNYLEDLLNLIYVENNPQVRLELVYTLCHFITPKNYHQFYDLLEQPSLSNQEKYLIISVLKDYAKDNTLLDLKKFVNFDL